MAHTHYTVGETYSSAAIQTAIDLIPGDLSSAGGGIQNVDVYYYDADDHSVAYAETLDIYTGFYNGTATDYIDVGAMVSHGGMRDGGIIIDVSGANPDLLRLTKYVEVHGFCITAPTISFAGNAYLNYDEENGAFYDNVFYDIANTDTARYVTIFRAAGTGSRVYNNIFACTYAKLVPVVIATAGTALLPHHVHNNTLFCPNSTYPPLWSNSDYLYCSNNYVYSGAADDIYIANNTNGYFDHNISSDVTAGSYGGTGNLINKAAVDQFECVTAGSENLQLRYTGACYRKGQDNSSLFTTDCAGNTWNHWETGALAKQYARIYNVDGDETDQITSNGVIIP